MHNYLMKRLLIPSIILLFVCLPGCFRKQSHTYETDDTAFRNGEILYPDYVHDDTIIIIDADSLNWAMEFYDAASDGDIKDLLTAFTKPLKK